MVTDESQQYLTDAEKDEKLKQYKDNLYANAKLFCDPEEADIVRDELIAGNLQEAYDRVKAAGETKVKKDKFVVTEKRYAEGHASLDAYMQARKDAEID